MRILAQQTETWDAGGTEGWPFWVQGNILYLRLWKKKYIWPGVELYPVRSTRGGGWYIISSTWTQVLTHLGISRVTKHPRRVVDVRSAVGKRTAHAHRQRLARRRRTALRVGRRGVYGKKRHTECTRQRQKICQVHDVTFVTFRFVYFPYLKLLRGYWQLSMFWFR
jgi:hypothetical protein